jgi:hypothetical protein
MSDNFDQQDAHSPTPSPSGSRQDGHNGGRAISSASRNTPRNPLRMRARRDSALLAGSIASSLADIGSFMLQRLPDVLGPDHLQPDFASQAASARAGAWT